MLKIDNLFFLFIILIPLSTNGQETDSNEGQKIFEIQLQYDNVDNEFYTYFDMGKDIPQKNFKFLVDTGSLETWVQIQNCTSCVERNKNKMIRLCEKGTCQNNAEQFGIQYGFGRVDRYQTFDYIIADDLQNHEQVPLQVNMAHVTVISKELQDIRFDGLLGLSPNEISIPNPFIYSFKREGKIDTDEVFSINFRKQDPTLILGGIKQDLIPQNKTIQYIPMEQGDQLWRISLQDFKVGNFTVLNQNQVLNQNMSTEEIDKEDISDKDDQLDLQPKAIIDSGTNFIVIEQKLNERLNEVLNKNYNIKCQVYKEQQKSYGQIKCQNPDGKIDNFPPLSFIFIDQNNQELVITIPPKQYVEKHVAGQLQSLKIINFLSNKNIKNNEQKIDKNGSDKLLDNEVILGQPFLQNQYVVFDKESYQIGFVQLDPLSIKIAYVQFSKCILVAIGVMIICYLAAQRIIKKFN